jgi:hypothetical protein
MEFLNGKKSFYYSHLFILFNAFNKIIAQFTLLNHYCWSNLTLNIFNYSLASN